MNAENRAEYGRLWFDARKLVTMVERAFERRLQTELGIGTTLYLVLSVVQEQPGSLNQRDVAELLGTTPATISRQLEVGTGSGLLLVTVSHASRRANDVSLTAAGVRAVERADEIIVEESGRLWSSIPDHEITSATQIIGRILSAAAAADKPPS